MTPNWSQGFDSSLLASAREDDFADFLAHFNRLATARGLQTGQGFPLQFVPQGQRSAGRPYESHIALTGQVPTRDNLHDRFNALVWLHAPRTKARLNQLQAAELQRLGGIGPRGSARDAATLMDENLALIVYRSHPPLLQDRDWKRIFWDQRADWGQEWQIMVFGHALMEKLEKPYLSLTAHCICLQGHSTQWSEVDDALLAWLESRAEQTDEPEKQNPSPHRALPETPLGPQALCPLPLMGIPGWHAENAAVAFYNNTQVFRPGR